nr:MAG TPA: hypothetical protein [Caudoviricetes sp.]
MPSNPGGTINTKHNVTHSAWRGSKFLLCNIRKG